MDLNDILIKEALENKGTDFPFGFIFGPFLILFFISFIIDFFTVPPKQ